MRIVRWDPFDELGSLQGRVNRLFEESTPGAAMSSRSWLPACDICEGDGEVVITVDLPGVAKEDIQVDVTGDMLTLKGERKAQIQDAKTGCYVRVERVSGPFERSFTLAVDVDRAAIAAKFDQGVLSIKLPKAEAAKPKQIPVEITG